MSREWSKPNLRKTVCDDVIGPLVFKAVQEDVRSMGGAAIMTEGLSCGPGAAMEECVAVAQHSRAQSQRRSARSPY